MRVHTPARSLRGNTYPEERDEGMLPILRKAVSYAVRVLRKLVLDYVVIAVGESVENSLEKTARLLLIQLLLEAEKALEKMPAIYDSSERAFREIVEHSLHWVDGKLTGVRVGLENHRYTLEVPGGLPPDFVEMLEESHGDYSYEVVLDEEDRRELVDLMHAVEDYEESEFPNEFS